MDGAKLWHLDSRFRRTPVLFTKYQQTVDGMFAMMTRGQQFHPSAKLSPLDLERRKLSRGITVFPRFLSPSARGSETLDTLFQRQFHLAFYKGAFCIHLHDNVVSHANVVCSCLACTCTAYAQGDMVAKWFQRNATNRGNNFACFDAIVSKRKEAYEVSAKLELDPGVNDRAFPSNLSSNFLILPHLFVG